MLKANKCIFELAINHLPRKYKAQNLEVESRKYDNAKNSCRLFNSG